MVVSEHELTTHEQLCSHLRTISCTIELHNLSSVYTPSSHYHSVVYFVFFVSYYSVGLLCVLVIMVLVLVCVSKVTNMTLQLALDQTRSYSLGIPHTGTKLQPAFSRQDPIYSLHTPDISKCTASILQTGANIQPVFSTQ